MSEPQVVATFRPESDLDLPRAKTLVEEIGCSVMGITRLTGEGVSHITVKLPPGILLEGLVSEMCFRIEHNEEYADLHRCAQTLREGHLPDENWFDSDLENAIELIRTATTKHAVIAAALTDRESKEIIVIGPGSRSIPLIPSDIPTITPFDIASDGTPDNHGMLQVNGKKYRYPSARKSKKHK